MRFMLLGFVFLSLVGCDGRSRIAQEYPAEVTALASDGGAGLPYLVGKDMRPEWKPSKGAQPRVLGAFKMKDQLDQVVSSEGLRGKIAIVSFFFSHCSGICPMTIKNLSAVQKSFLDDDRFVLLSFSVTPEIDSPKLLQLYAQMNQINHRRWRLVTGDRDKIYSLARESFSADTRSPSENAIKPLKQDDFLHSENVYLLDRDQKLRGVYSGRMMGSIQELISDARSLTL